MTCEITLYMGALAICLCVGRYLPRCGQCIYNIVGSSFSRISLTDPRSCRHILLDYKCLVAYLVVPDLLVARCRYIYFVDCRV